MDFLQRRHEWEWKAISDRYHGFIGHRYISVSRMDTGSYCRWWDRRVSPGNHCNTPHNVSSLNGKDRESSGFDLGTGRTNYNSSSCHPCPNALPGAYRISVYFCHAQSGSVDIWEKAIAERCGASRASETLSAFEDEKSY